MSFDPNEKGRLPRNRKQITIMLIDINPADNQDVKTGSEEFPPFYSYAVALQWQ